MLLIGPEDRVEQARRRRILDEPGLPYLLVDIDPAWRLPGDVHPERARRARHRRCRRCRFTGRRGKGEK
jgi:hypothetical protein